MKKRKSKVNIRSASFRSILDPTWNEGVNTSAFQTRQKFGAASDVRQIFKRGSHKKNNRSIKRKSLSSLGSFRCECGREKTLGVFLAELPEHKIIEYLINIHSTAKRLKCEACGVKGQVKYFESTNFDNIDNTKASNDDSEPPIVSSRLCESCGEVIPPGRLAVNPNTRLCVNCKEDNENIPERGVVFPPVPPGLRGKCPRCEVGIASVYQNNATKNFFVGCSSFPKCQWSKNID